MLNRPRLTIGSFLFAAALLAGCGTRTTTISTSPTGSTTPPATTPPTTTPTSPTAPPATPPAAPPTPQLDHIAIVPPSLTVAPGSSFNFTATAFDQFNNPFTAPITWTSDGNPATNGSGTAQNAAETPAVSHIVAVSGTVSSAAAILTVTGAPPILTTTQLNPANPTAILT